MYYSAASVYKRRRQLLERLTKARPVERLGLAQQLFRVPWIGTSIEVLQKRNRKSQYVRTDTFHTIELQE